MTDRILRRPEVQTRIGLSRSTIYEGIAQGQFPRPIRIGRRAVGWPESIIDTWIAQRSNELPPLIPGRTHKVPR